jgi:hypothetical protein
VTKTGEPNNLYNKALWKLKLPLRIKSFMWFLLKGYKDIGKGITDVVFFSDNNETI